MERKNKLIPAEVMVVFSIPQIMEGKKKREAENRNHSNKTKLKNSIKQKGK